MQIFKQTGLSSQFCNLLTDMWTEHTRWCSWNGAVHPVPMVTHGMPIPQGECLGPLTCCLWLSAGQRYVDQQLHENLKSSIFMGDRSFVAKDADTLVAARSAWAMWSSKVGLLESLPKIQMTAKSMRHKTELQSLIPESWFQQEVTMLGVVSRGGRRTNAATEEARFAKAKARLNVLAGLRLDSNLVAVYSRIFAVSLCSYGWIARLPVKKDVDAIWKLIKKGQKVLRSSNTWLRCMVHGGISHLSPICACNLFRVVATIKCRYQITWTRVGGSPVAALRKWFTEHRFSEVAPWVWTHCDDETIRISADCCSSPHLDRMRHLIREGWRLFCWDQFLQTSRHEISTAAHVSAAQLRAVNWATIRALSAACPASRTVAVGGTVSPAWFHSRADAPFPDRCPWCPALGSWVHLCWECPCSPLASSRPPVPSLGIARRFGWCPRPASVLPYLASVQSLLWEHRYGVNVDSCVDSHLGAVSSN